MAVKTSNAATRVLAVLDLIAEHQPIGISALAKLSQADRSAIQRAVATLAASGWIRPTSESATQWELTAHVFAIAALPQSISSLRSRSRSVLAELGHQTRETAFVAVPDGQRFTVIEAVESAFSLRVTQRIGQTIGARRTATGRAFLAYLDAERQRAVLGEPPRPDEQAEFAAARDRGFGLSVGDISPGVTNIAAAIFDQHGDPIGVLVLSAPSDRLPPERHAACGALVSRFAMRLSRSQDPPVMAHPAPMAMADLDADLP